jgi:hypothetical protein
MEEKKVYLFDKYPVLAFVLPIVGGFFAWYFSKMIVLGLFVAIGGLIMNVIILKSRGKL